MGFWAAYHDSLKAREVEEPIDLWLHRPLGYLVARALLPTALTANHVTLLAVVVGYLGAAAIASSVALGGHLLIVGAACLVLSAVLDCADGQLARLRKASSEIGRMLDGSADSFTMLGAVTAITWVIVSMWAETAWQVAVILVCAVATVYTSQFHTSAYDHYKNVFLRMTVEGASEGEDLERAEERRARLEAARPLSRLERVVFPVYLSYLRGQRRFVERFDPAVPRRLDALPAYEAEQAATYRRHLIGPMRLCSSSFGVGSLVFGMALFTALGRPDLYIPLRLIGYNAVFWLVLGPMLRRASRRALEDLPALAPSVRADEERLARAPTG